MSFVSKVIPRALIPVAAVALALAMPAVASAHAALVSSDPPADASVATAPPQVSATFNEDLEPAFAAMTVVGPDQGQWAAGPPEVSGTGMSMPVKPLGPAGTYTVNYRVTSADGHVVEGAWSFELTAPGGASGATGETTQPPSPSTAEPTPTSSTTAVAAPPGAAPSEGLPAWPFLVAAPVVVIGAVLAFWALGRWRAKR